MTEADNSISKRTAGGTLSAIVLIFLGVGLSILAVYVIELIPEPMHSPIADLYQKGTNTHRGLVIQIDPEHRFPDGTVREGLLVRNVFGTEEWFPRMNLPKAEVVMRK